MILVIDDKKVHRLCTDPKHAQKKLGAAVAKKLRKRLKDLHAAPTVFDVPEAFRPHALKGDRNGQFAVDLDRANRIVFEPADDPIPRDDNDGIDWPAVRTIRITEIGDYHD